MLLSRSLLFIGLAFVFVGTKEIRTEADSGGNKNKTPSQRRRFQERVTKAVPTLGINDTGEDDLFDLGDALKDDDSTNPPAVDPRLPDIPLDFDDDKTPAVPKNRKSDSDGFDLSVALDGDDQYTPTKPSKPAYVPNEGDSDRQFVDTDLIDAAGGLKPDQPNSDGGRKEAPRPGSGSTEGSSQGGGNGTITGVVTGLLLALGGGVSSYILYQKKKLCFGLGNSTEQNAKQDNVQGQREDPQSYSTLLQSQPVGSN